MREKAGVIWRLSKDSFSAALISTNKLVVHDVVIIIIIIVISIIIKIIITIIIIVNFYDARIHKLSVLLAKNVIQKE